MDEVHASCVALHGKGVLVRGPSGSGKSDLCLRLIDRGALLVADDRVILNAENGSLWASCPAPIAGCIEVRGVGVLRVAAAARAPVVLVVDLGRDAAPRLPEPESCRDYPVAVPRIHLDAFDAAAAAKVRAALGVLIGGGAVAGALIGDGA